MRYAVFSDVHGNDIALKKMLSYLEGEDVDGYIYLGDCIGYFCRNNKVIDILRSLNNLYYVIGNHDAYYISAVNAPKERSRLSEKYGNSYYSQLSECSLEFLKNAPAYIDTEIYGNHIFLCHGSMKDNINGRIYPDTVLSPELYKDYDVCFHGHTHYQMLHMVENTMVVNPGSLGQPRDGKGYSYCIFDFATKECHFKTVTLEASEIDTLINENFNNNKIKQYLIAKLVLKK